MCAAIREGGTEIPSHSNPKIDKKPEIAVEAVANAVHKTGPRLIFLTGTSTAGKTSIIREFERSTPKSKGLGTDDFAETRAISLIKNSKEFDVEYAVLSQAIEDKDLYRFLFSHPDFIKANPHLYFKESTKEQKAAAIALIDSLEFYTKITTFLQSHKSTQDAEHFETILSHSNAGVSVIFDSLNEKDLYEYLSKTKHHVRIERFLVYVPLSDLINRLPGRNAEADKTGNFPDRRQNIDLINQFMRTYRKAAPDEPVVDVISREEIQKIFADKREDINRENQTSKDNRRSSYAVEEDQVLEYFGLTTPGATAPITTISDFRLFDGIFRTATQTTITTVQELSSRTWKRL